MSYLPPEGREALLKETIKLVSWTIAFIVALGIVSALTQGIVIKVS